MRPVYENIPIWSVILFHFPGTYRDSISDLNKLYKFYILKYIYINALIVIILSAIAFNSVNHLYFFIGSSRILPAIRAGWDGGFEYETRIIILT